MREVRYACRSLLKSPGFAAAAILTLALGIGANTAIFSALQGVVLSPLPYPEPDRLVLLGLYNRSLKYVTYSSYPDFLDWQRNSLSFERMAVFRSRGLDVTSPGAPEHLDAEEVSATFFDTLGVRPALGRGFTPDEDRYGAMPAVIISDRLWRERFAARPAVLGQSVTMNGTAYTIVGVLPRGFLWTAYADVYTPAGRGDPLILNDRTIHSLACVGRVKAGVTIGQARAELNSVQEGIDRLNPATEQGQDAHVEPLQEAIVGNVRGTLLLLLGAVGLVLLIACANVANLLLARSVGRAREFAIRLALGAKRKHIVRQLVTEALVLSIGGGVLGLVIAKWGLRAILAAVPGSLPRSENIGLNLPVLLFALGVSVLVGLAFGFLPAWRSSSADLQESLKEGGRGSAGGHHRTQSLLSMFQVALALILLTGASLLVRTIHKLWEVNPGFDTRGVLTFKVGLSPAATKTAADMRTAYQQLIERIRRIPGVLASDLTALVPLGQHANNGPFWVDGQRPVSIAEYPRASYYWTGPDYLRTMRIPLLRGRFLSPRDTLHAAPVVVIDSGLAHSYFPGRDPVGQTMTIPHWGDVRIIGVVGHVTHWRLDGSLDYYSQNQIYASFYQLRDEWAPAFRSDITIIIRTQLDASAALPAIKAAVYGAGNDQPVYDVHTMQELAARSMASQRLPMVLLAALAVLALLLACIGIYGVISYAMSWRVREIGIRMALGAVRVDVLRLVMQQGLRLALAGVAVGLAAAMILTQVLSSFSHLLYGVRANDPLTLLAVSLALVSAALVACYIPARRAARTDPMDALRHE
jgi:predicted permease